MHQNSAAVSTHSLPHPLTVHDVLLLLSVWMLATCMLASAVVGVTSSVIDLDISGVEHFDQLGQPTNTVIEVIVPSNAVIQGVGWSGTLTTIGESWASDADIAISDGDQQPGVIVTPAEGHDAPTPGSGTHLSSGGIISLGSMNMPGVPITSGVVRIEFAESFVDDPGEAESFWGSSATFSIMYEIVDTADCPADLNNDSVVDVSDLLMLLSAWGACPTEGPCNADLNGDDVVDVSDLLMLLSAWGSCPAATQTGACCFADGSCSDLTQGECTSADGTFQGDFTNCETWACPQPPDGSSCQEAMNIELDTVVVNDSTGNNPEPDSVPQCGESGIPNQNGGVLWYQVRGNGTTLTARTCDSELEEVSVAVYCAETCVPGGMSCVDGSTLGECDNPFQATVSWCSADETDYFVAVWGAGTTQGEISLIVESGTACQTPVECALLCDELCGGFNQEHNCWCDTNLCPLFGDCCPGLCQSCPGQPGCTECATASCPPGGIQENEPCGQNLNGGCITDSTNPPMDPIACGDTICGTVWASGGLRDSDWFKLDLSGNSQPVDVLFNVVGNLDLEFFVTEEGCPAPVLVEQSGCELTSAICLQPGVYSVIVRPVVIDGFPCSTGPHRYTVSVACDSSCAQLPDSCENLCGEQAPDGCWCDDECDLFGDCCDDICDECPDALGC